VSGLVAVTVGMRPLPWLMGEKHANWGKHRTEVTEGGLVSLADDRGRQSGGAKPLPWLMGEKHANRESIAQRSRRSQRGDWQALPTIEGDNPGIPFLISVTLGDGFSGSRVSRPSATVSPKPLTYNASSPSVTSVTSVRCFPQFACLSPISATAPSESSRPKRQCPLCDLCDLCAMLSPNSRVSPPIATVSPKPLTYNASSPLCDLCDLCAMLSPIRAFLAPPKASHLGTLSVSEMRKIRLATRR
jgi:hypothetical protein